VNDRRHQGSSGQGRRPYALAVTWARPAPPTVPLVPAYSRLGSATVKTSLAVLCAVSLFSGCRSDTHQSWSCAIPARHACSEWPLDRADAGTWSKQQESCYEMGGTVGQGPCSEANAVGTCYASGGAGSRIVYYGPKVVADARQSCTMLGGTWR
jgi:hypothetical protein